MIYGNPITLGGGSGGDVYAFIVATYPAGSVCTASDGTTTLTAGDTSGSWVFKLPNAGTWTITSTDGVKTTSTSVVISYEGQSESVVLMYALYLIKNGIIQPDISFPVSIRSGRTCDLIAGNGYQRFSLTYSGGRRTDSMIDVAPFSILKCNVTPGGDLATGSDRHGMYVGLMQTQTATSWVDLYNNLSHKANTLTKVNQTLSVDLSSVTGTYNVAVCIENNSSTAYADVYDLWFE